MIRAAIVTAIRRRLASALAAPTSNYAALSVEGDAVGWLDPVRLRRLAAFRDVFAEAGGGLTFAPGLDREPARTTALDRVARTLGAESLLTAWRDECYAVAPAFGAAPWFLLERAAARYFGIRTFAAHVNGLCRVDGEIHMWIARRSAGKAIDPGQLDNAVGGGIAAFRSIAATVVKECAEEAGIPAAMARLAQPFGSIDICRKQPDGLQRETIFIHDLWLPPDFTPAGQDGEVAEHRLVSLPEAARLIANAEGSDVVTVDASLVVLDCLLRLGLIDPASPDHDALLRLRSAALAPRTPAA
jgi:8-oxo-dGTP pyrophosphatase MutT (NUDIX family)